MLEEFTENVSFFFGAIWTNKNPIHDFGFRKLDALPFAIVCYHLKFIPNCPANHTAFDLLHVNKSVFEMLLFGGFVSLHKAI